MIPNFSHLILGLLDIHTTERWKIYTNLILKVVQLAQMQHWGLSSRSLLIQRDTCLQFTSWALQMMTHTPVWGYNTHRNTHKYLSMPSLLTATRFKGTQPFIQQPAAFFSITHNRKLLPLTSHQTEATLLLLWHTVIYMRCQRPLEAFQSCIRNWTSGELCVCCKGYEMSVSPQLLQSCPPAGSWPELHLYSKILPHSRPTASR